MTARAGRRGLGRPGVPPKDGMERSITVTVGEMQPNDPRPISGRTAEEEEFAEYFATRLSSTRRIAYLMCQDWHWADDLAQVAFVRLSAAWHTVRDRGALDAFLRT